MKYIAILIMPSGRISDRFPTIAQAEQWLDSQNNNHECTTVIGEVDENDRIVDSFIYTVAASLDRARDIIGE